VLKAGRADASAMRNYWTSVSERDAFATEAAALTFAEQHKLAAQRLLAVNLEGIDGVLAILSTVLPGRSKVPDIRSLRALGAAAATLHAVPLSPRPDLPLRTRPRQGEDYVRQRCWAARYDEASEAQKAAILEEVLVERPGWPADRARQWLMGCRTTPLIQAAEERLRQVPLPEGETVFVHGDLCGDNTVWTQDAFVGIIDWEGAGAGHYGVDLGNLRFEETLHFGLSAAAEVLEGWQQATGQEATRIAYWDLVAALNTPADLVRWAPGLPGATERRDAFLRAALDRLDHE
jgi:aminoglycoside phosphotransferase (APT) family kinase protein